MYKFEICCLTYIWILPWCKTEFAGLVKFLGNINLLCSYDNNEESHNIWPFSLKYRIYLEHSDGKIEDELTVDGPPFLIHKLDPGKALRVSVSLVDPQGYESAKSESLVIGKEQGKCLNLTSELKYWVLKTDLQKWLCWCLALLFNLQLVTRSCWKCCFCPIQYF